MIAIVTNTSEVKSVIQYAPFQISINADYTDWNKAFANITDAILVIKKTNSNSDSAFLSKKLSDSEITITDVTKLFTIDILQTDFTKLKPDTYSIRLGILFTGETQYRDVGVIQNGTIQVNQSWLEFIPLPE